MTLYNSFRSETLHFVGLFDLGQSDRHMFFLTACEAMMPLSLPEKSAPAKAMPSKDLQDFKHHKERQELTASQTAVTGDHQWQVTGLQKACWYMENETVFFWKNWFTWACSRQQTCFYVHTGGCNTLSGLCGDDGCSILIQTVQRQNHSTTCFLNCFELQNRKTTQSTTQPSGSTISSFTDACGVGMDFVRA